MESFSLGTQVKFSPKKTYPTTSTQTRCISRPVQKSDPEPKSARTYTRVMGVGLLPGVGTHKNSTYSTYVHSVQLLQGGENFFGG